jgi:hypothetical protein
MLTIFGAKVTYDALAFSILFVASEYIGLNKRIRSNTVAQLIVKAARFVSPYRKEDDKISRIKQALLGK